MDFKNLALWIIAWGVAPIPTMIVAGIALALLLVFFLMGYYRLAFFLMGYYR